jgi:hypothetical protein
MVYFIILSQVKLYFEYRASTICYRGLQCFKLNGNEIYANFEYFCFFTYL